MEYSPQTTDLTDASAAWLLEGVLSHDVERQREIRGDIIGPYVLLKEIGEGGFGVVWKAQQAEPVTRQVALKMIKWGMDSREVLNRFEQERHLLARMTHPNIAAIIDAGMAPDGRPYFVMELVSGTPIARYCLLRATPLRQRIELFQAVCMGVQHAHQKGVIHRDLKPSNILVADVDGQPIPKIIDFGIAKATMQKTESLGVKTRADVAIGSPLYMSPEQLLSPSDVDTRSDIYSLGAVLYEIITGLPPFDSATLDRATQEEMRRIIKEDTPQRPSRQCKVRGLALDLDWIVLRALEKEPHRRYATAAELQEDLQRYLDDLPTVAHPPSFAYLASRWIKRNRTAFIAAALSTLALTGGLAMALWQANAAREEKAMAELNAARATEAEDRAEQAQAEAEQTAAFLNKLLENTTREINQGRNPEAFKLALDRSYDELNSITEDVHLRDALRDRLAKLYSSIGDWSSALGLMKLRAESLARSFGPNSAEAWAAEFEYLRRLANHGPRKTVPPLLEAARERLGQAGMRGTKPWLDTQRELVRVSLKLSDGAAALRHSEALMAEVIAQRVTKKKRITYLLCRAEALEFVGKYAEAEEMLEQCQQIQRSTNDSRLMRMQIHERLMYLLEAKKDFARAAEELTSHIAQLRAETRPDQRMIISALQRQSGVESAMQHYPRALALATEALDLAKTMMASEEGNSLERDYGVGACLLNLSERAIEARQFPQAVTAAKEALHLAETQGNTTAQTSAWEALAAAWQASGDYRQTITAYQSAQEFRLKSPDYVTQVRTLESIVNASLQFGHLAEALACAIQMWEIGSATAEAKSDAEHMRNIAEFGIKAWKALKAEEAGAKTPPELRHWQAILEELP